MLDKDQLREAIARWDRNKMHDNHVWHELAEAARLVADPDTLIISKVDGEWPRDLLNVLSEAFRAKYPRANISAFPRAGMVAALAALLEGPHEPA